MTQHRPLSPASPWVELQVGDDDWDAADPELLRTIYAQLVWIRAFEQHVLELAGAGLIHGPAHSSIGQEAGAVGSVLALTSDDSVNGSHRGHHQFLAKALHHVEPKGLDPLASPGEEMREVLLRTLAEICGLDRGWSHGRGGSMHLQWKAAGAMGTNAIVGGGVPQAAGFAWSHRQAGTDAVSVTYFGDGATNIGSTLETMNLAAAWKLPVCFFIENNHYAVSTNVDEATGEPRLSARGLGFNIAAWRVDGMDPLAVHLRDDRGRRAHAGRPRADDRRGRHLPLLPPERRVRRAVPSATGTRTRRRRGGRATPSTRPPLISYAAASSPNRTRNRRSAGPGRVMEEIGSVLLEGDPNGKPGQRRIKDAEWPDPAWVDVGHPRRPDRARRRARGDRRVVGGRRGDEVHRRRRDGDGPADGDRRARWSCMGEDIHRLNGGTNGATRGLAAAYPDRVLGTPISENAFAGLAGGIAMDGRFVPVVEFMYADFMWVAADQLFNQIGKARHMYGGMSGVPLVLRSKVAMGTGYGSQHSMDPAGVFATSAGWRIVAPSHAVRLRGADEHRAPL